MKKFNKNIAKEFTTGFGRFIAIMAIIALGVGFLIGVMQATPDMKNTMDGYYTRLNASDVTVKGTLGLTQEDVEALKGSEVVEDVTEVISTDAQIEINGKEVVGRFVGLDLDGGYLNTLTLTEGRLPQKGADEVVAIRSTNRFEKIQIGTKLVLDTDESTYGDVYKQTEFEVVGIVTSPDYYYLDGRETTSLGTGAIGTVVYGYSEDMYDLQKEGSLFSYFENPLLGEDTAKIVCTDCWIRIKGADGYSRFRDGYKNYVLEKANELEALGKTQSASLNKVVENLRGLADKLGGMLTQEQKEMLAGIPDAQWYVLDRASTNVSYVSFDLNAEKVENIAGIFPVFFIFVAALVALASMTRMVDEDRIQIGTFKALGYSRGRIMSKYLIYCCLASIIGCIGGILCGFALLPSVFWRAYETMYQLPSLSLGFSWVFAVAVFGIALLGTVLVTWGACRNSLKEKPSNLMQPKAPKPGKRILLERVGFLWKPLKFKWKATIRNIFRYKKNMILTIVSVMGCTALILTGFGLNDSVNAVTQLQYGKVLLYDTVIEYTGDVADADGALREFIGGSEQEGEKYLPVYMESGRLILGEGSGASSETVDLYVVEDDSQFNSFVSLHERKNSAIIKTSEEAGSVVLPENIAIVYGIGAGDTIYYSHSGGTPVAVKVSAVCENYTGSYVYIGKTAYESLFGAVESHNVLLVKSGAAESETDEITKEILSGNGTNGVEVQSVEFTYSSQETMEGLSSTMGLVIAILVISAGALAAIVLYNLTNINIDERRREIATLRVLGYRKWEVAGYIYRESAILTIAGTLFGLLLGMLLHLFIIDRVNSVAMMFGRVISGWSYLWAFLLTLAFAALVYAFMLIKLNRINMAESLKSNE